MKNKYLLSIILAICTAATCSACVKTDTPSNAASGGKISSFVSSAARDSTTSDLRNLSSSIPFSEYLQQIKNQSATNQLKCIFKVMDSSPQSEYLLSPSEYGDAIKTVQGLLKSDELNQFESSDYSKLSPNLHLFETKNMKVIEYEPDPAAYGEINANNFAFIRQIKEGKANIISLYNCVTKHIGYVFEEAENILIVAGEDKYVNPYFAYVDGFSISDKKAEYFPVVSDFTNALWKISSNNGWVRRNSEKNFGTSILTASSSIITVQSTDQYKISFMYHKDRKKYSIDKIS